MTLETARIKQRYQQCDFSGAGDWHEEMVLRDALECLTSLQRVIWMARFMGVTRERALRGVWDEVHGPRLTSAEVAAMLGCDDEEVRHCVARTVRRLVEVLR